jgi:hypothetical protein
MSRAAMMGLGMALAFGVGCGAGYGAGATATASSFVVPPARAGTNPARWEYTCMVLPARASGPTPDQNELANMNKAGAEGWELATVQGGGQFNTVLCFKRPLP